MIKSGVDLRGIVPQMAIAYMIANEVYRDRANVRCIITSANDSKHGPNSLHYKGKALDLRTFNVPQSMHVPLTQDLKAALGPQFDVVLESDHIHIEFDPKDKEKEPEL